MVRKKRAEGLRTAGVSLPARHPDLERLGLFAGPIIAREVRTAPRALRYHVVRTGYVGVLFVLMWTAWQSLIGYREVRDLGVLARFGGILFQVISLLQLTLILFFAPLAAATAVAHEKDRRTFLLLLMTDLSDLEIVAGKLTASLLQIVSLLATAAPVSFLCLLLGGVSPAQVGEVFLVTAAAGVVGGSLGLLVALWRDRTFQSLALTMLVVALVVGLAEGISSLTGWRVGGLSLADVANPYRSVLAAIAPSGTGEGLTRSTAAFTLASLVASLALNAFAVAKLRVWNPGRNEPREQREAEGIVAAEAPDVLALATTIGLHVPRRQHRRIAGAARAYRIPWSNPILWRELRTRAYGTKPLIIKGAYALFFALGVAYFYAAPDVEADPGRPARVLGALAILSLIIVNAQGVTALTSERDIGALDLLLVTELSPRQFIFGKLHGVLYNAKEMLALPVLLTIWLACTGKLSTENAFFYITDFLLLAHFAGMLGLHAAIAYTNSRQAVAHSLGTIFFLMVGILLCAFLIILSDREFNRQLVSFAIFIGVGSLALFGSLGARNPSNAIGMVALLTPFCSFYCVISLLIGNLAGAFLVSMGVYGFALLAMLVPAVSDFDIALGRTSAIQG